jgi:hypothetical protein
MDKILCDFCRRPIDPEAFDAGRAAKLLKKIYCEQCMTAAIRKSKSTKTPPDLRTPPARPLSRDP